MVKGMLTLTAKNHYSKTCSKDRIVWDWWNPILCIDSMNRAYISFMVIRSSNNNNNNNNNNKLRFEWPNMFSTCHKKQIKSYCHAISCNIWHDEINIPKAFQGLKHFRWWRKWLINLFWMTILGVGTWDTQQLKLPKMFFFQRYSWRWFNLTSFSFQLGWNCHLLIAKVEKLTHRLLDALVGWVKKWFMMVFEIYIQMSWLARLFTSCFGLKGSYSTRNKVAPNGVQ